MATQVRPPGTYIIPASLRRTPLPDGDWITVRGMDKSQPQVLLTYTGPDNGYAETWLSLGDTVVVGARTLRFENLEFGNTASDWTVYIQEVLPGTPPYQPPAVNPIWQPAELRPFGTLEEAAILALEQRIGTRLPRDYRQWLAENNGAAPVQDVALNAWSFCLNDIHPLLGVHPDVEYLDLSFGESRGKPWLTDDYLVIAVPIGGFLAVKTRGTFADQIIYLSDEAIQASYAYDKRFYTSATDYLTRTALIVVAGNIIEFCHNLQPLPPVTPGQLVPRGPVLPADPGPDQLPPR